MANALPPKRNGLEPPLLLLGGSFDPIHHGHLRALLDAAAIFGVSQATFLPANVPALRDPLSASAEQRLAMLRLAVAEDPTLAIDDREIARRGPTYTVQTLLELRERWPSRSIIFLLGADAFSRLTRWREWQRLLELAHLGVLTRPGEALRAPDDPQFLAQRCEDPTELTTNSHGNWCSLGVTPLAISATDIRSLIGAGQSARFLLPDPVLDYIHRFGLYASSRANDPLDSA